jgi:hypothetical protein
MQVLESQAAMLLRYTSQLNKSSKSFRQHAGQILRRALTGCAAFFDRRAHAEAAMIDRYVGRGWTDSTERQLTGDIEKIGF